MTTSSSSVRQQGDVHTNKLLLVHITLAACLVFWTFVFADSGWGPILVPLSNQLQVSLTITGLFYVSWSTGYLPGALIGGSMLDRYGPRRVLVAALLIILCGLCAIFVGLLLPRSAPVIALLVIAGLAGIGGGVIDATTNGLISAIYAERRGMALNLFNLLYPLGGLLVALIDAGLLRLFHNDPRPALIFTMCYAVGAMISLLGIPRGYKIGEQGHGSGEEGHTIGEERYRSGEEANRSGEQGYKRGQEGYRSGAEINRAGAIDDSVDSSPPSPSLVVVLAPVILVMIFTSGISSTIRAWAPAYLHVAYAQAPAIAAALSSITWALATGSRLGAAFLIVRIGSWRMVMLGVVLTLLGLAAVMLSPNAIIATLAIALTSIGLSPIFATCLAIGSERAGRSLGSVAGILLFVSGISTVFSSWFFGFLLNTVGPLWPVIFCFTFVTFGGAMALRLRPAH
jgi:MFS family permease